MKIFGIGLSKTGTTSLASALDILGYRTKDYPGLSRYVPGDLTCFDAGVLEQNEALTDTPIPSFYRELDRQYPGAKFILTVRAMDGWLQSCRKQFTARHAEKQNEANNRLFEDLYGTAVFEEESFRRGYRRFVEGVMEHFAGRPQDLLVLDVAAGQGWPELCAFLGKPVPEIPFPKANVTRIQWMDLQSLVSVAREAGQVLLRAHRSMTPAGGDADAPAALSGLLRKTLQSLRGATPSSPGEAATAAQAVIARALAQLNPEIPVVSRLGHAVPMNVRGRWNHFWLVDPLDGEADLGTASGQFTVNIALIEDQRPIAGVVHAPVSGTTYYAMAGKGAYKAVGEATASRLSWPEAASSAPVADTSRPAPSRALNLCRLVESGRDPSGETAESMEWQSAAPHALARLLGRRIVAAGNASELAYNKVDWCNKRIHIA